MNKKKDKVNRTFKNEDSTGNGHYSLINVILKKVNEYQYPKTTLSFKNYWS